MLYSILLIVVLVLAFRLYKRKSTGLTQEQRKKMLRTWLFIGIAILIALLAFAKGNVIAGAIASLVALFTRALPLLRFVPLIGMLFKKQAQANSNQKNGQGSKPPVTVAMDKAQAADILGVDINASKEEIIAAHKRLMQKVHPDKGGSDALAIQINEAKRILLH